MKYHTSIASVLSGILFGTGLALSEMTSPDKVRNFLDVAGTWDPALLFVMVGAVTTSLIGHWWLRQRRTPLYDTKWHFGWDMRGIIDTKLVAGSALFGIGWGIGGLCPGPAIGNLLSGSPFILVFLASMFASMAAYKLISKS